MNNEDDDIHPHLGPMVTHTYPSDTLEGWQKHVDQGKKVEVKELKDPKEVKRLIIEALNLGIAQACEDACQVGKDEGLDTIYSENNICRGLHEKLPNTFRVNIGDMEFVVFVRQT